MSASSATRQSIRLLDGMAAIEAAETPDAVGAVLVETAMALVPCDNGAYTEIDPHLGRNRIRSNLPEIDDWARRRAEELKLRLPDHPATRFRFANPHVPVVRLSDVADMHAFLRSALYVDVLRETGCRHQVGVQFGYSPRAQPDGRTLPVGFGLCLNRSGGDFSDRNLAVLETFCRVARPVLARKRAARMMDLMERAELTPDLLRLLMGHGLSERQAEVAFWMIKGKSNTDIGAILDIGADTVRHHSIAIFRRLGVDGRLSLQRTILRSIVEG